MNDLKEDGTPTNAIGDGGIEGAGVDKPGKPGSGEPGVPPNKRRRVVITDPKAPLKRSALKSLMGFREWTESE